MTLLGVPVQVSVAVPDGVVYRAGGGPLTMNARTFAQLVALVMASRGDRR